jgi:hypothetical protein
MTSTRLKLQALLVLALGAVQVLTPSVTLADPVQCTQYCADYCDTHICDPCYTADCARLSCTGVDNNVYQWDVGCTST